MSSDLSSDRMAVTDRIEGIFSDRMTIYISRSYWSDWGPEAVEDLVERLLFMGDDVVLLPVEARVGMRLVP